MRFGGVRWHLDLYVAISTQTKIRNTHKRWEACGIQFSQDPWNVRGVKKNVHGRIHRREVLHSHFAKEFTTAFWNRSRCAHASDSGVEVKRDSFRKDTKRDDSTDAVKIHGPRGLGRLALASRSRKASGTLSSGMR